jgi:hypothetical protein
VIVVIKERLGSSCSPCHTDSLYKLCTFIHSLRKCLIELKIRYCTQAGERLIRINQVLEMETINK